MSDPVDRKKRATYQDVLDAPQDKVAEILSGDLHLSPRPAAPHTCASALDLAMPWLDSPLPTRTYEPPIW